MPTAAIWLVVHRDNRQTPRIRAVLTHVTERVRLMAPVLYLTDAVEEDTVSTGRPNAPHLLNAEVA